MTGIDRIILSAQRAINNGQPLPFSIYQSTTEQHIINVPIVNPLLIVVLSGTKKLGQDAELVCQSGDFLFLANDRRIDMRNIPMRDEYLALLIEFEYQDFSGLLTQTPTAKTYVTGEVNNELSQVLQQFIDWSLFAPQALWAHRRREIIEFLYHLGYDAIGSLIKPPNLSQHIHELFKTDLSAELTLDEICKTVGMSESTLRRRLRAEQSSLQEIRDRTRLGHGLHLLQTTLHPVGYIAAECGYQSQSRFTERFKQSFGLTPTELRRTRMTE